MAMIARSQQPPLTPPTHGAAYDRAISADPAHPGDQDNHRFLYANCSLGLILMDPVDFHAFAKGQLIAMAILIPAALALFMFSG